MFKPGKVKLCESGHAYAWHYDLGLGTSGSFPLVNEGLLDSCPCGDEDWGQLEQRHGEIVDPLGLFALVGFDELSWTPWGVRDFDDSGHPIFGVSAAKTMRIPRYTVPDFDWGEYRLQYREWEFANPL